MVYDSLLFISGLLHKGTWQKLKMESCSLRNRGLAQGTWANKVSHLRAYVSFTCYFGVQPFPVQLGVLLRFIALLARGPYASSSASNILGSLKWFSVLLDPASDKIFEAVLVAVSLKGLKAQLSRPVRQKLPFTVDHLHKFYNSMDFSSPKQLACWCAILLAFFGCFRLSNLVPSSKNMFDPLKHLKRNDIYFHNELVLVFYKYSKTNQNSDRVSWIPICSVSDIRFNIKFFLEKLFSVVDAPENAPLFTFQNNVFHTRHSLVRLLDQCVFEAGLPLADYSWHSFRRGSAVFAFELGLADSAVQLLGDWTSPAFKRYLEFAFSRKVDIAKKISKSFDQSVANL